jgi:transposase-like protein
VTVAAYSVACYLAMAIGMDGEREVLGMWFQANEGAKFWMQGPDRPEAKGRS